MGRRHKTTPDSRAETMAALYRDGKTLHEIGQRYGITRERVRQIITKYYGLRRDGGGQHVQAIRRREQRDARRDARSLKRWGCPFADYVVLRNSGVTRFYSQQRANAFSRGIEWQFNLWDWWCVWRASGKWSQRGRGNNYAMCRKGDVGPYSKDNVFIARGNENSAANNKSGLPTGVRLKRGAFVAIRCLGGKPTYLGTFTSADLAHAAYLAADPFLEERAA